MPRRSPTGQRKFYSIPRSAAKAPVTSLRQPQFPSHSQAEIRLITLAAKITHFGAATYRRTMTDFVVSAVQAAAQHAIEQAEVVRLSLADQERFAQALLSPPEQVPALKRAFARRSKLFAQNESRTLHACAA